MRQLRFSVLLSISILTLCGCTTLSLERNTVRQAETISDIRYREALENLAMLAANPASLPSFSSIYAGTTDIMDNAGASSASTFGRIALMPFGTTTVFGPEAADFNLSRTIHDNWTLDPVIVPEKLRALRCACRWMLCGPDQATDDFNVHLGAFHPADPKNHFPGDPAGFYFDVADRLQAIPAGWLKMGNRRDVPRCARYQAHYKHTYVWVMPDGVQALSEFTLTLQGIARVIITSVYHPLPNTVALKWTPVNPSPTAQDPNIKSITQNITVNVDQAGYLAPGPNQPVIPLKVRVDNFGQDAQLRSQINAASK